MPEGRGLFVGWYDADPTCQPELDLWHSSEHMPERARLPGFLTAQRYRSLSASERYCVLYRTRDVEAFISRPYLEVLNNPTKWTRKMMPGIVNLNRTLCEITRRKGSGYGGILHTIRISPASEGSAALTRWLDERVFATGLAKHVVVRLELAVANREASQVKTRDKDLRGQPDAVADWVILAEAYSEDALEAFGDAGPLRRSEIERHGATVAGTESFRLVHLIPSG